MRYHYKQYSKQMHKLMNILLTKIEINLTKIKDTKTFFLSPEKRENLMMIVFVTRLWIASYNILSQKLHHPKNINILQ